MGGAQKGILKKVMLLQKRAIRCIDKAKYNSSVIPICKKLHFLQLNDIYDIQVAKFMHCYINDNLPIPIKNLFVQNTEIHNYNTRQQACTYISATLNTNIAED